MRTSEAEALANIRAWPVFKPALALALARALARVAVLAVAMALPAGAQSSSPAKPSTPEGWRALTLADLEAAAQLLRDHSPIPFDKQNPNTAAWLEAGLKQAKARVPDVRDEADWFYVLSLYGVGFNDPHVVIAPTGELPPSRWPGFIVSQQGADAVVVARDEGDAEAPAIGTVIRRCDGKTLAALADERVFPVLFYRALPTDQRRAITRLFFDRPNAILPTPSRCQLSVAGVERELTLRWRDLPTDRATWMNTYRAASTGPATEWGVSEPDPGVFWIGVPTFGSGPQTAPKLDALVKAVAARGDEMRRARAIVIDTRGNGGGNSAWADKLAEAIFTPEVLKRHPSPSYRSGVDWRASRGNAAYWRKWADQMKTEFGEDNYQRALRYVERFEAHADDAVPLFRDGAADVGVGGGLTTLRPRGESPFAARVYFLSNGSCGSSCLNFADRVLFVPGVKLIGLATSGDGLLMDVRNETLPSGLARLVIPQKVARGRGRGALEVYAPDVAHEGPWDDASVRRWVLSLVDKDRGRDSNQHSPPPPR
ncbi:MAG: hypothetical protein SF172_08850 [Burkholderiales bacterium]|nr:hypothetical protein [Burkholderiales bacterium]